MENQIPQEISHIENVSTKSPTAENFLNHVYVKLRLQIMI